MEQKTEVEMFGKHMLAVKVEKSHSDLIFNDTDKNGAVYEVIFVGPKALFQPGDKVVLRPGNYGSIVLDGNIYTTIEHDDVLARVKL